MWWLYYNFYQITILSSLTTDLIDSIFPYELFYQFIVLGIVPGTSYTIDFGLAVALALAIFVISLVIRMLRGKFHQHEFDEITLRAL